MKPITASIDITAPQETVWEVVTNLAGAEARISGILKIEILEEGDVAPGVIGMGTRWRETRKFAGKESTEVMWVTACDAPNSYVVEAESCGCHYKTSLALTPKEASTTATWAMEAQALTFMAKVMGTVMAPLMKRMMMKCLTKDLEEIKVACEANDGRSVVTETTTETATATATD